MKKERLEEIDRFVAHLIFTNESIWIAICSSEDLVGSKIFKEIVEDDDDSEKLLKIIATKFYEKANASSDTKFADPECHAPFQEFSSLGELILKYEE